MAERVEAVESLKEIRSLIVGHEGPVRAVRFNSDGNYCMTCGSDKTLRLSNPHKGILLKTYIGHGYEVLDAIAANENDRISSCGTDKTVILWDVSTGKCIRKFRGHFGVCTQLKVLSIEIDAGMNVSLSVQTLFSEACSVQTRIFSCTIKLDDMMSHF